MLKSIVAIIVSYLVVVLLFSAVFLGLYFALGVERVFQPDSYEVSTLWLVLTMAGSFFGWMFGGWLCIAISKSLRVGRVFALIVFVLTAITCLSQLNRENEGPHVRAGEVTFFETFGREVTPRWFHFVNPLLSLAGVLAGARVKRRSET